MDDETKSLLKAVVSKQIEHDAKLDTVQSSLPPPGLPWWIAPIPPATRDRVIRGAVQFLIALTFLMTTAATALTAYIAAHYLTQSEPRTIIIERTVTVPAVDGGTP